MNLAEKMLAKSRQINNREKLDAIFNEFVLPQIEKVAENKGRQLEYSDFNIYNAVDSKVRDLFPKISSIKNLVETEMKPYLEELGFKVVLCSPSYFVYIRW